MPQPGRGGVCIGACALILKFGRWVDTCGIFMCLIGVRLFFCQIRNASGCNWGSWFIVTFMRAIVFQPCQLRNSSISLDTLESITPSVSPSATFVWRAIKRGWQMAQVISGAGAEILWQGSLTGFNSVSCEGISGARSFWLPSFTWVVHLSVRWRDELKSHRVAVITVWSILGDTKGMLNGWME